MKKIFIFATVIAAFFFPLTIANAYHSQYPPFVKRPSAPTLKLDVPFHRQQHKLSCEVAALKMLLLQRGIDEPENDIIPGMKFGPIGSDPDFVFVGDINGKQPSTGYGIHWDGLANVARTYLPAQSFHRENLHFLIDRLHDGNAVIIWGSLVRNPRDASWLTPEGKFIPAVHGEHTWVVTGYAGPRRAPTHIFTLDPIFGERVFTTGVFLENWAIYHNSGMFFI